MKKQNFYRNSVLQARTPIESIKYMTLAFRSDVNRYEKNLKKDIYIQSFCTSILEKLKLIKTNNGV